MYYRLYWIVDDMSNRETITVNGFPVHRHRVMSRSTYDTLSVDLNTALMSSKNVVKVQVEPYLRAAGAHLTVYPQQFTAEVTCDTTWGGGRGPTVAGTKIPPAEVDSAHAAWSRSARRQWQTYRETAGAAALDSLRAWARRHPMTVRTTFDNEQGPDFSDLFEEAPIIEGTPTDSARLRAYAMHLRDLMAAKDTTQMFVEAWPRLSDGGYSRSEARSLIATNWFAFPWRLNISSQDLGLEKWADGRVWELYRKENHQPLFVAGKQRRTGLLDIYVAEVDDSLRVVR